MFDAETVRAVDDIAARLKVDPAALLAVAEVESGGKVFAMVNGRQEPLIRWEGHYFDRRLVNGARALARGAGLASPKAGGVPNPASQAKRWAMVDKARHIDEKAADESFSIGVGQVMTAHWKLLKYRSAEDLIAVAQESAAGQIEVMARYIEATKLDDELRRHDWTAFARGYNGPGFRKGAYHIKIAKAYARITGRSSPPSDAAGMLRMGSHGAKVRELQTLLVRAGYAVKVDGDFGTSTRDAVKDFQKANRLEADGVAGPATMRALDKFRQGVEEKPGEPPITEVPEVKDATKGGGLMVLVIAARDQIAETAGYLTGIEADTAQTVANVLLAGSGIIGVGLAAWGIYGLFKSRQTDEGDVVPG